jgi:hypothetical protein
MIDIVLILISNSYFMLLSYDSDMVNRFENYINDYIHLHYTKLFSNNQLLILSINNKILLSFNDNCVKL